jgi:hypothetical protein
LWFHEPNNVLTNEVFLLICTTTWFYTKFSLVAISATLGNSRNSNKSKLAASYHCEYATYEPLVLEWCVIPHFICFLVCRFRIWYYFFSWGSISRAKWQVKVKVCILVDNYGWNEILRNGLILRIIVNSVNKISIPRVSEEVGDYWNGVSSSVRLSVHHVWTNTTSVVIPPTGVNRCKWNLLYSKSMFWIWSRGIDVQIQRIIIELLPFVFYLNLI